MTENPAICKTKGTSGIPYENTKHAMESINIYSSLSGLRFRNRFSSWIFGIKGFRFLFWSRLQRFRFGFTAQDEFPLTHFIKYIQVISIYYFEENVVKKKIYNGPWIKYKVLIAFDCELNLKWIFF